MHEKSPIDTVMREKLEEAAKKFGFRDLTHYYQMLNELNFFIPGVQRKFNEWRRHNGTNTGLNVIFIQADKCPSCFHGLKLETVGGQHRCHKCGAIFDQEGNQQN